MTGTQMTGLAALPLWAAIPAAILLVLGATLTLIGSVGLYRLTSFYERLHAPTLGTSWGAAGVVLSSALIVSVLQTRPVVHEILIAVFVTITTPVTLMLLGRAVLFREEAEDERQPPDQPD
jgi:multicomponent K+:H+ antiporter subunit G